MIRFLPRLAALASALLLVTACATQEPPQKFMNPVVSDTSSWTFIQSAAAMTFDGKTLTLHHVSPDTIMYTDSPERLAHVVPTWRIVQHWGKGKDNFKQNPPDADVNVVVNARIDSTAVQLSHPKLLDKHTLSYQVKVLNGTLPSKGKETSIFIDGWYCWWAWHRYN